MKIQIKGESPDIWNNCQQKIRKKWSSKSDKEKDT